MNWNTCSGEERLHLWKQLRNELCDRTTLEQLGEIARTYSSIRIGRRSLDFYDPGSWLTPWEIIYYGEFCKSSVSLLIFYTYIILNKESCAELWLVKDNSGDYLLPVIDNQYILNYEAGVVSNYLDICDYFVVMQKFSKEDARSVI